jgi:signal transduction histidine kinase
MLVRRAAGLLIVGGAFPSAAWLGQGGHLPSAIPTVIVGFGALAVGLTWPMARDWIAWPAAVTAAVSLGSTVYVVLVDYAYRDVSAAVTLGFVEMFGLLIFLTLVTRWSRPRTAVVVGAFVAAAATLWILRFILIPSTDLLSVIGGCAVWSGFSLAAVVAGGYPRFAAIRLQKSIIATREAQRMELAHDLHDFVAHDVTGMVAQAQAARFAGSTDWAAMQTALERIEAVGQQALAAMDSLVGLLRERESDSLPLQAAGVAGLPDVVERFRQERAQSCTVTFNRPDSDLAHLAPEVQLTACRVVVESLTNIRRHAAAARQVTIDLRASPEPDLRIVVKNDVGPAGDTLSRVRQSGKGLAGLADRVAALGGRFDAGPDASGGWVVFCELPTTLDGEGRTVRSR